VIGTTVRSIAYVRGTGTNSLVFSYKIQATDKDVDGIALQPEIVLGTGTIRDKGGNPTILTAAKHRHHWREGELSQRGAAGRRSQAPRYLQGPALSNGRYSGTPTWCPLDHRVGGLFGAAVTAPTSE